jgi:uncharacterized protein (UPF0332 family)
VTDTNRLRNAAEEWRLSRNFLAACDHLAAGGMYDRATSQLYYALLHVVRALLFTDGIEGRSHRGVRHLLNLHFVAPGRLERSHLQLFHDLQDEREAADYALSYPNDRDRFEELRSRARVTFDRIGELLQAAGVTP